MLIGFLAALLLLPIEDARPARPTDAQLLDQMVRARPGMEILRHTTKEMFDGDGRAVCGTARIEGQIEPFAIITGWGPSWSPAPNGNAVHEPTRGPDHWIVMDIAPARPDRNGNPVTGFNRIQWDAMSRKQAMSACPELVIPEGVVWTTEVR